jgi:hypothetical protein
LPSRWAIATTPTSSTVAQKCPHDCAKQHVRVIITCHIVLPGTARSDDETDQKQTRSSTPGQTKRMTHVFKNVIAIAILTINGKGGVVVGFLADCWKEESPIVLSL